MKPAHLATWIFGGSLAQVQWIGLRENLQENPITFMGKSMVSCKMFLKPIQSQVGIDSKQQFATFFPAEM